MQRKDVNNAVMILQKVGKLKFDEMAEQKIGLPVI